MKRFIRYLYEYENEKRIRNVGFVKVEAGCEETIVHLQAKGFRDSKDRKLVLYLFYEENEKVVAIRQAEIVLTSPVLSEHLRYGTGKDVMEGRGLRRDNKILECEVSEKYDRIRGILIETGEGRRMAATWDDMPVDVSRMEEFVPEPEVALGAKLKAGREEGNSGPAAQREEIHAQPLGAELEAGREEENSGPTAQEEEMYAQPLGWPDESRKRTTKIQRKDISRLPRCEWKLANNKFLIHGYNNYHHLLLITEGNHLKLGVPGIYHIEEAKCAETFGFGEFLSAEEIGVSPDYEEENQKEMFGYWCRLVRGRHI